MQSTRTGPVIGVGASNRDDGSTWTGQALLETRTDDVFAQTQLSAHPIHANWGLWVREVTKWLRVGGGLRYDATYTQTPHVTTTHEIAVQQGRLSMRSGGGGRAYRAGVSDRTSSLRHRLRVSEGLHVALDAARTRSREPNRCARCIGGQKNRELGASAIG